MPLVAASKKLIKFDPKTFLSTLNGGGRKIAAFSKKQTIFAQGDSACSSEIAMLRILHFLPIEFLKQSSYFSHNLHERERCDGSTLPRSTDEGRL